MKENDKKPASTRLAPPQWQIPPGLTSGNLDYINSISIAADYDSFLSGNRLYEIDRHVLDHYLPPPEDSTPQCPVVADFGCGNGRTLLPLVQRGYHGLGIDLSRPMLEACQAKAAQMDLQENLSLCLGNLVQLDAVGDSSLDAAICMFSTLGMIHGRKHRQTFLRHVRRMLKPTGQFIVHAHSAMFTIRQPGGMAWLTKSLWRTWLGRQEWGDRWATYRGVKNMFIHSFRRRELARDLRMAGFETQRWIGIPVAGRPFDLHAPLPTFSDFRNVGWTVVC